MHSWRLPMIFPNDFLIGTEVDRVWRNPSEDWSHVPQAEPALLLAGRLVRDFSGLQAPSHIGGFSKPKKNRVQRFSDLRFIKGCLMSAIHADISYDHSCC